MQLLQRAVKCLLSLGADARGMWQPHACDVIAKEDFDAKSWFSWPMFVMLMLYLGDETLLRKGPFSPGQLAGTQVNVLHLAVRCNTHECAHASANN